MVAKAFKDRLGTYQTQRSKMTEFVIREKISVFSYIIFQIYSVPYIASKHEFSTIGGQVLIDHVIWLLG